MNRTCAVGGTGSTVAEGHREATRRRSAVDAVPPTVTTMADRSEAGTQTPGRANPRTTRTSPSQYQQSQQYAQEPSDTANTNWYAR